MTITPNRKGTKFFNGESLKFFLKEINIKENFELADQFYDIHVFSNYLIISLIAIHILAVIFHKIFFKESVILSIPDCKKVTIKKTKIKSSAEFSDSTFICFVIRM